MKYYIVSHASWETYSPIFLIGPEMSDQDFENLCNSLMERAAFKAIEKNFDMYVGWGEIVKELALLLEEIDFQRPEFTEITFSGPGIIRNSKFGPSLEVLGSAATAVINHNEKIRNSIILE